MWKRAGLGATLAVLLVVFGMAMVVGTILWMMLSSTGIQHSPSESGRLRASYVVSQASLRSRPAVSRTVVSGRESVDA